MAAKTSSLNIELKKLIKKLRPNLTYEQERMYREHPEIMLESIVGSYKQFCEGQGIDYKTTAMYQEEQKFHQCSRRGSSSASISSKNNYKPHARNGLIWILRWG